MSMSGWFVLQTKPHKESAVARSISAYPLEIFLPRIVERARPWLHMPRRVAPMFPSYLFVNVDVDRWGKSLRYTPGARDFLRCEGVPQSVSAEIIATLKARVGPEAIFIPPPPQFRPGERLCIADGPLRGLDVIFERELSGPERVAVLLAAVTLPARVVLPAEALRRA